MYHVCTCHVVCIPSTVPDTYMTYIHVCAIVCIPSTVHIHTTTCMLYVDEHQQNDLFKVDAPSWLQILPHQCNHRGFRRIRKTIDALRRTTCPCLLYATCV